MTVQKPIHHVIPSTIVRTAASPLIVCFHHLLNTFALLKLQSVATCSKLYFVDHVSAVSKDLSLR